MTEIDQDRAELDQALADQDNTLLILTGDEQSNAQAIHDKAEGMNLFPWRRVFILREVSVLSSTERELWGDSDERFASWSCSARSVGRKGPAADLLRRNGAPSILRIRGSFAAAEKL